MRKTIAKTVSASLIALLVLSAMTVLPVFLGGTQGSFPGPGAGDATFFVHPRDNLFTSSTPITSQIGEFFTVDVRVNGSHIASWQVELSYNKNYLTTSTANVSYSADMIFPGGSYSPVAFAIGAENATHNYVLGTATTNGAIEYPANTTTKGLIQVVFKIIADPPAGIGNKLWSSLYLERPGVFGCFALDTNLLDNDLTVIDGYYENAYVPPPPAHLEISPTVKYMPQIPPSATEGDKVVGTPRALYDVDILIKGVADPPMTKLFFVRLAIYYDPTVLSGIWIYEGTFMNNSAWAPHGTIDNMTVPDTGVMYWWIRISPNSNGNWSDNTAWPSGDGLLAIARFEVMRQGPDSDGVASPEVVASSALDLEPILGEYFIGDPDGAVNYLPYDPEVDGLANIYGYYWKNPVAVKTHPITVLVGKVVPFDGSGSYGYRDVLGNLVIDASYIASWFWDFDDGTNSSVGPITTHIYTAMGIYTVTLTVTDLDGRTGQVSQQIEVIFGRLIDVFVGPGAGPYPAPYGGQGHDKVADMFEPQKTVCVYTLVTYNGEPVQSKLVTFIVISPHNLHDFSRTAITNGTGYAYIEFGLPWPCVDPVNEIFGTWNITAKVDIRSQVVEDTVAFKVWWGIEVTAVVPQQTSFYKGDIAGFDVFFRTYRMQPIDGVIELTVYDDLDVPIGSVCLELNGQGWGNYTRNQFKNYTIQFGGTRIPKWAFVGTGIAYANAFHVMMSNPYHMGSPYCPEKQATFNILKTP